MIKVSRSGVAYSNYCKSLKKPAFLPRVASSSPPKKNRASSSSISVSLAAGTAKASRDKGKREILSLFVDQTVGCGTDPTHENCGKPAVQKEKLMIFRHFPTILTLNSTPTSLILLSFPKKQQGTVWNQNCISVSVPKHFLTKKTCFEKPNRSRVATKGLRQPLRSPQSVASKVE